MDHKFACYLACDEQNDSSDKSPENLKSTQVGIKVYSDVIIHIIIHSFNIKQRLKADKIMDWTDSWS